MAYTYPPAQRLAVNNPRKAGAIFTLIGAILVYFAVVSPIYRIQSGAHDIQIIGKFAVLGVVVLAFGLMMLIFGARVRHITHPTPEDSKVPAIICGIIVGGAALGTAMGLHVYAESMGYVFRF
jgi:threonine/homoserine/homoserine lactone efflux protein